MDFHDPKVREMTDEGARMMFRSRHIYVLLAGLLHLGVGAYFTPWRERWRKVLQLSGSALMVAATLLLLAAFFYEPPLGGLRRPLTLPAIVALVSGVVCHLLSATGRGKDSAAA